LLLLLLLMLLLMPLLLLLLLLLLLPLLLSLLLKPANSCNGRFADGVGCLPAATELPATFPARGRLCPLPLVAHWKKSHAPLAAPHE
jgi:hypothetical protein